jgi:tRNA(Ile)-lysidine synthase
MRRRGLSGEAGLRELRREFLVAAARRAEATAIATAHTADDQLETLLMRLARGTGLVGMAGMRARQGPWLKPLLHATRADIERDLRQHRLSWCEDASNATPAYTRNRVRHGAVPALLDALRLPAAPPAQRRERLARRAAALAQELADAGGLLSRLAAARLNQASAGQALDAASLAALPPAIQRLALARAWRRLGPAGAGAPGLTGKHLGLLTQGLAGRRGRAEVALPLGWRARIEHTRLWFEPPISKPDRTSTVTRRAGRADARLSVRLGPHRSAPAAADSAHRRRRRTTPHLRTPA